MLIRGESTVSFYVAVYYQVRFHLYVISSCGADYSDCKDPSIDSCHYEPALIIVPRLI